MQKEKKKKKDTYYSWYMGTPYGGAEQIEQTGARFELKSGTRRRSLLLRASALFHCSGCLGPMLCSSVSGHPD